MLTSVLFCFPAAKVLAQFASVNSRQSLCNLSGDECTANKRPSPLRKSPKVAAKSVQKAPLALPPPQKQCPAETKTPVEGIPVRMCLF